jgi:O-acetyl-ADP-ribose deacetylase (regulator of RNase III)
MAEITHILGNCLKLKKRSAVDIIAHGCNDQGKWGAGFTGPLGIAIPRARDSYLAWAAHGRGPRRTTAIPFELGRVQLCNKSAGVWVANMITQIGVRSLTNPYPFSPTAFKQCLIYLAGYGMGMRGADTGRPTIHMPRVGCGLGGGTWEPVQRHIEYALAPFLDVFVYTLPGEIDAFPSEDYEKGEL